MLLTGTLSPSGIIDVPSSYLGFIRVHEHTDPDNHSLFFVLRDSLGHWFTFMVSGESDPSLTIEKEQETTTNFLNYR